MSNLFGEPIVDTKRVAALLDDAHYLGQSRRGFAWEDDDGVIVLSNPASRHLPADWLELNRWLITGGPNAGSRQWAVVRAWLIANKPDVTTVVSYSDPSVGHTGALYRACGWLWAPGWHRWDTPPSGNGQWTDAKTETAKDRWVDPLRPDDRRLAALTPRDSTAASIRRRHGDGALYREPLVRRGRIVRGTGGADYVNLSAP